VRDVCGLALVCRAWAAWVRSDAFWRRLHAQRFDPSSTALPSPFTAASFPSLSPPEASSSPSASSSSSSLLASTPSTSKWLDDFKLRHERARGWRRDNCQETVLRGHQLAVTAVRMWSAKDRVFSASADRYLSCVRA
jgi:hypothetical protein